MGKLFNIPDIVFSTIADGFDDILELTGKQCKLHYPTTRFVDCNNCVYDPIGKKSSNRWITGGPMPFHGGACPMCNGQGKHPVETSDNITMSINWGQTTFNKSISDNIRVALGGIIETRGYLTDLPKIKRCEKMMIKGEVAPYGNYNFKLDGEPSDPFQIVPGKYFIANWMRVG